MRATPRRHRRRPSTWLIAVLVMLGLVIVPIDGAGAGANDMSPKPTIVLVHGDWADGSSWSGVIARLQREGFTVVAPPNPLRGPSSDAAYLSSYLQTISGPIVLVAHSYGGFVTTNAALGNPDIAALVYIDAFIPDEGETSADLLGMPTATGSCIVDPANSAFNPVPIPGGGIDLYLRVEPNPPYTGFVECFANGVNPATRPCSQPSSGPPRSNNSLSPRARQPGRRSHRGR